MHGVCSTHCPRTDRSRYRSARVSSRRRSACAPTASAPRGWSWSTCPPKADCPRDGRRATGDEPRTAPSASPPLPLGQLGAAVFIVPAPPRIRWGLGVIVGRVLPVLLASERGQVEVTPGAP